MSICKNNVDGNCSIVTRLDCNNSFCKDYNDLVAKVVQYIDRNFVSPDDLSHLDEDRESFTKEELLNEYFDGEDMPKELFNKIIEKLEFEYYTKSPFID